MSGNNDFVCPLTFKSGIRRNSKRKFTLDILSNFVVKILIKVNFLMSN
jgi:hypothetical protein